MHRLKHTFRLFGLTLLFVSRPAAAATGLAAAANSKAGHTAASEVYPVPALISSSSLGQASSSKPAMEAAVSGESTSILPADTDSDFCRYVSLETAERSTLPVMNTPVPGLGIPVSSAGYRNVSFPVHISAVSSGYAEEDRLSEHVSPNCFSEHSNANCFTEQPPVNRSSELLARLSAEIRALGNYGASFTVEADGQSAAGFYAVGGDRYYIRLGDAEVYCDGKVRYEVDHRRKEVSLDGVNAASRSILDNPTRAFDLVGDEFASELLWERDGRAAVKLTPKTDQALSAVTLTLDTQTMRPRSLEYDFDGERIRIVVRTLEASDKAPKEYVPAEYRTYETIDFR